MKQSEKNILTAVADSLHASTVSGWTSGSLDEWSQWARRMKQAIRSGSRTIEGLMESPDDDKITNEHMFEILSWLDEHDYLTDSAGKIYKEMKDDFHNSL